MSPAVGAAVARRRRHIWRPGRRRGLVGAGAEAVRRGYHRAALHVLVEADAARLRLGVANIRLGVAILSLGGARTRWVSTGCRGGRHRTLIGLGTRLVRLYGGKRFRRSVVRRLRRYARRERGRASVV